MLSRLLRKVRPRSVYDVMAAIACFGVLAGGTAYAANTIGSTDIIDGQVKSVDVGDNEIKSADVKDQSLTTFDVSTFLGADIVDGSLTGKDVGIYSGTVGVSVGTVPAHSCVYRPMVLPFQPSETDHVILTGQYTTTNAGLTYSAEPLDGDDLQLKACNPYEVNLANGTTTFNVLVIPQ